MSDTTSNIELLLSLTSSPSSPKVTIQMSKNTTASELRNLVSTSTHIPLSSLKLIFRGRLIPDDAKVVAEEYKLENGCVVHCMGKPTQSTAETTTTTATTTGTTAPGPSISIPTNTTTPTPPATLPTTITSSLLLLKSRNSPSDYTTALSTLSKLTSNIISHPLEEKYRTIKKSNAAFQKRLGGKAGGEECMKAIGFEVSDEKYSLEASPEKWPKLVEGSKVIEEKMKESKRMTAAAAAVPPPQPSVIPPVAPPGMQNSVANMMSDPNALRSMLQNPMVQQAMANDPRMANNPMLRQSIEALQSNPELINQVSSMAQDPAMMQQMQRMMQDPMMRQRMQQMMGGGNAGLGAGLGAGGGMNENMMQQMQAWQQMQNLQQQPGGGMPNSQSQQQQQQNQDEEGEREMTEEEMIAEAIARSLRES